MEGCEARKKSGRGIDYDRARNISEAPFGTARLVRSSAYVRVVESPDAGEENAIKARAHLRRRRIQLHSPSPILILPLWMAILFKGASATGEHGKGCTTGYCGARFVVARFYKFAGIKRKNAVCLDVRAHRPLPPSLSYALPNPLHPLLSPLPPPSLFLSRSTGQGYIFLTVSSRTTKPAAHFWGLVGFLIKAAAVTPTPRMHGIVRGIFGRKNHPSPLATTVPRSSRRGAAKPALFNNHPFDPFSSPRLSNRGSRFSMPRSANLFRTTFARQSGALGYSKIDIEKRSEFFEMKIVDNNRFDAKVQRVSFNSLGFFFLSHFSFFPSPLFLSSFRKRQEWKRAGGETGNNNFSEIARLFPQKENPIYAQGEARRESIFAGPPLRFNI